MQDNENRLELPPQPPYYQICDLLHYSIGEIRIHLSWFAPHTPANAYTEKRQHIVTFQQVPINVLILAGSEFQSFVQ
jgi:hypothetical protein